MKGDYKSPYYDLDVYRSLVGEQAVEARLKKGMLPIIDIAGHPFFVEVRLDKLTPMDNFLSNGINLSHGSYFTDDGKHRIIVYDKTKMEDVDLDQIYDKDKLLLVRVPSLVAMDPIMTAKLQDYPDRYYLDEYPMVMYRVAEVIPLTQQLRRNMRQQPRLRENPERLFELSKEKLGALQGKMKQKRKGL